MSTHFRIFIFNLERSWERGVTRNRIDEQVKKEKKNSIKEMWIKIKPCNFGFCQKTEDSNLKRVDNKNCKYYTERNKVIQIALKWVHVVFCIVLQYVMLCYLSKFSAPARSRISRWISRLSCERFDCKLPLHVARQGSVPCKSEKIFRC